MRFFFFFLRLYYFHQFVISSAFFVDAVFALEMRQTSIPACSEKRGTKRKLREVRLKEPALLTRRCETTHRYRREADVSHGNRPSPSYPLHPRKSQGCINNEGIGDPAESFHRKLPAAALSPARGISGAMDRDVSRDLRIRSSRGPAKERRYVCVWLNHGDR